MICKNIIFISIIILLFTVIITNKTNIENFSPLAKIAIVSMVTIHPDFDFWLEYHLNTLGIDHIFLRVEDSPQYKEIIDKYPNRITATYHSKKDIDTKHNYLTIMDRQKENVNSACDKAKEMGIDFLFHCDADELIHVVSPNHSIRQNFRKYLNQAKENDDSLGCIHFKNFEAVFPKMSEKCFTTNKFIDCKKGRCLSYANGKSCGLVQNGARFKGPHYFSGKNYNMPDNKIVILHYDSCTYKQWNTKFNLLKDTDAEKLKKIPFPFYKNSIRKLKECSGEEEKVCKNDLRNYFKEQKIDNYYKLGSKLVDFDAPKI
jgi:hypothetical protein|uniref:Glycosyltransferase 2-like domain-containing protein n=1 Tax=viral metagenome TaxID=1070528 RepID=A0A6C0JCS9_9ZZZZ